MIVDVSINANGKKYLLQSRLARGDKMCGVVYVDKPAVESGALICNENGDYFLMNAHVTMTLDGREVARAISQDLNDRWMLSHV